MATDRPLDEQISRWLEAEAPHRLPDRVLRATFERTRTTRQQGGWRVLLGRINMSRPVLALGGAAIVVMVAAVALNFFGDRTGVGAPASPSRLPIPSATASVGALSPSPSPADLPQGPHLLANEAGLSMRVTIPSPDWYGEPGGGGLIKHDNPVPSKRAGMIVFHGALYVYGDPCKWATTRPDSPSTSVDAFVDAISAQASRGATEPVDVTVDGYAGKSVIVHVPDDARFATCDERTFGSWGLPGSDPSPFRYHQAPGQIDRLWVLDVDGDLVVIDVAYYQGTSPAVIDELNAMVESTKFG